MKEFPAPYASRERLLDPVDAGILLLQSHGRTQVQIAEDLSISSKEVAQRQARVGYRMALRETRQALIESSMDRLNAAVTDAVECIQSILSDKSAEDATRLKAADSILRWFSKVSAQPLGLAQPTGIDDARHAAVNVQESPEAMTHLLALEKLRGRPNGKEETEVEFKPRRRQSTG